MAQVAIDIEIICEVCSRDLRAEFEAARYGPVLRITPCDDCLSEEYDKGYKERDEELVVDAL